MPCESLIFDFCNNMLKMKTYVSDKTFKFLGMTQIRWLSP